MGSLPRFDNYFVEILGTAGMAQTDQMLDAVCESYGCDELSTSEPPGKIKFWECLPNGFRAQFLRSRFSDTGTSMKLLAEPRLYVDHLHRSASV